ncbi:MAG: response regulator transcription factor [Treponema sp.]|jgi:DNA-binding NarL/FixJ family response regulator|nr:response regulator transcription factor [Treponema sp.]
MICIVIIGGKESELYTKFIASQTDISIIGQGRDGYDALKIVPRLKPDIVLLDEILPPVDIADITLILRDRLPKMRVIILTSAYENTRILKAISCGASGYLLKDTRQEKFIAGIKTVYNGGCLMSPEIAAKAFRMFPDANRGSSRTPARQEISFPRRVKISRQELQIITCISKGFSNREISKHLTLKEGTVRNYITSILEKTGLKNRTQIAIYACNTGFMNEVQERKRPG